MVDIRASDLHLQAGSSPFLRVEDRLRPTKWRVLSAEDTKRLLYTMLSEDQIQAFERDKELDFAYTSSKLGRFRGNAFWQRGCIGIAIRRVLSNILGFEELGLPPAVKTLCEEPRGMILVTGTTGSGKTTTLGAMIDYINSTKRYHIITIEDPIEILHENKMGLVDQREVKLDTKSFANAVRQVLRQDPDVILIGELRDLETMEAAINAADSGHLVLSTMHTLDASETINRIIDIFPSHQQEQIRAVLSSVLQGVISQRLLPRIPKPGALGLVPAVEVMISTSRIQSLIKKGGGSLDIKEAISEGEMRGMQTFDQALWRLYQAGAVRYDDALAKSTSPHDFEIMRKQTEYKLEGV